MNVKQTVFGAVALSLLAGVISAGEPAIPVRRIALFSSGVGFFEHTGSITGDSSSPLVLPTEAVNDVLKSLIVSDPSATFLSVTYPSEETLYRTLRSLKVDLSSAFDLVSILSGMRGAELEVLSPDPTLGRILTVENRMDEEGKALKAVLTLSTREGIKAFALDEISSFKFTDPEVERDLARALDLVYSSLDGDSKTLTLNMAGKGTRNVRFAYVKPSPVWKASYRLELSGDQPLLQGWAIVDNTSDDDWNNVELSLVTGRPVSFVQRLYEPYYVNRPVVPLAIAGYAEPLTNETGYGQDAYAASESAAMDMAWEESAAKASPAPLSRPATRGSSDSSGYVDWEESVSLPVARDSGDLFEFTVAKPVTIARQQSAMIPLVEKPIKAKKVSLFSGEKALSGGSVHPYFSAKLENSTGMKLPAGPITVFDGGSYAGDALIEFFPVDGTRLISFGEDLSVSGTLSSSITQELTSVKIVRGVMTIIRTNTHTKKYQFKNEDRRDRSLLIEHPITRNAELAFPARYEEKTDSVYRFAAALAAGKEMTFEVRERSPARETITLGQTRPETLYQYSSSQEIKGTIRVALEKAVEFRRKLDEAQATLGVLESQKKEKTQDQERIRQNLQATGTETQQGRDYLKKLTDSDKEIEAIAVKIESARKSVQEAKSAYETYLSGLSIE